MASICPPKLAELKKNPSCFVMFCLKSKGGLTCFAKSETIKTKKKIKCMCGQVGSKVKISIYPWAEHPGNDTC